MKHRFKRSFSLLCAIAILVGLLPTSALAALSENSPMNLGHINGFNAKVSVDAVTSATWESAFVADRVTDAVDVDGTQRSAALNGKLWVDKSLEIQNDDKSVDVTFSALSQTFASQESNTHRVAYDVVFVVDLSPSMAYPMREDASTSGSYAQNAADTRLYATTQALNAAADTLMADGNNRMAVVTFGSYANTMVPLGHYAKDESSDFFSYEGHRVSWNSVDGNLAFTAQNSDKQTQDYISSTNPQAGVVQAYNVFDNATKPDDGLTHIPVIIMLTDGTPNYGNSSSYTASDGWSSWWRVNASNYFTIIQTMAYRKGLIQQQYQEWYEDSTLEAKFYTIGLGSDFDDATSDQTIMLDPSKSILGAGSNTLSYFINSYDGDLEIHYADESHTGSMTEEELNQIFQTITGELGDLGVSTDIGESTGGRNRVRYTDTLGVGVQLTGKMTLTVPTYQITTGTDGKQTVVAGDTRVYTLQAYKENGEKLEAEDGPDYLEKERGTVYFKPVSVTVGDGVPQALNGSDRYDKAALESLSIQVIYTSAQTRQINAYIPPDLMAYNVFITRSEDSATAYGYYESANPIQLTYGIKMRADVKAAGDYLVSQPAQTWVDFSPLSTQNGDGSYQMPYYWPGGQFEKESTNGATTEKTPDYIPGSSSYVTAVQPLDSNNNLKIYLGNNGLYTLEGKELHLSFGWNDSGNQDGVRPTEAIQLKVYTQSMGTDTTNIEQPTAAPNADDLTEFSSPTMSASQEIQQGDYEQEIKNQYQGYDMEMWGLTRVEAPIYSTAAGTDGQYLRYWVKVPAIEGYTLSINNENGGDHKHGVGGFTDEDGNYWFCFWTNEDGDITSPAGVDVLLTHEPEAIEYTVTKHWENGITEPDSVTMQLYANGQPVNDRGEQVENGTTTFEVTKTNSWKTTLNLPKYLAGNQGVQVSYTLVELEDNYTAIVDSSVDGEGNYTVNVTNHNSVDQTTMTAVKIWDDANNQDGKRPTGVTVTLKATANGQGLEAGAVNQTSMTATLNAENNWRYTWQNLPERVTLDTQDYDVTYTVEENAVEGYTPTSNNDTPGYVFITNTHTPATGTITINKTWSDSNDQDGIRPASIGGTLYSKVDDGDYTPVQSWTMNTSDAVDGSTDHWSKTRDSFPLYSNGQEITYYISENAVTGYGVSVAESVNAVDNGSTTLYPLTNDGYGNLSIDLTNSHKPADVKYTVTLVWNDNNNVAQARPDTVTVNVNSYAIPLIVAGNTFTVGADLPDGLTSENVKVENDNQLTVTLPQFQGGVQQSYSSSLGDVENYTSTITAAGNNSITYTLSYSGSTTYDSLGFTKQWVNYTYNGYDMRPSTYAYRTYLTLQFSTDHGAVWNNVPAAPAPTVTANSSDGANTVTYSNLPRYDENGEITYRVVEENVPNFQTNNDTVELKETGYNTLTNTFTLDGSNTYGAITVTKEWTHGDAPANIRPTYEENTDPLEIMLYRSTDTSYENGIAPDSITVNGDTWTYTWDAGKVLKTNATGGNITYVAHEGTTPDGYVSSGDVTVAEDGDVVEGATITNTYNGAAATGTLTIVKDWKDSNNQDSIRPSNVSFNVYRTIDGNRETVDTVTVTADGGWTKEVELPVTVGGVEAVYSVEEINAPSGYTAVYSPDTGVTLTANGNAVITVTNTYTPDTWTLTYNANGGQNPPADNTVYSNANKVVSVKGQESMTYDGYTFLGWSATVHGVVTTAGGVPEALYNAGDTFGIGVNTTLYAVWAVDANGDGIPDYKQKQITVNVVWDDDGNRCGIRPDSIEFTLKGETYTIALTDAEGVLVTNAGSHTTWIYTVPVLFNQDVGFGQTDLTGVNVDAKLHEDESDTDSYTSEVAYNENTYTITLKHTPETTSHSVTKTWDFGASGFTPANMTAEIQLLGNGRVMDNDPITFTPQGGKELKWDDLPKYENGSLITYHAVESKVLNGGDDVTRNFSVSYDLSKPGQTKMTNTYTALRDITLIYTWDDNNNEAGTRPTSVTVDLFYTIGNDTQTHIATYADGEAVQLGQPRTITKDANGNWSTTWNDLLVYAEDDTTLLNYEARVVAYTDANGTTHNVNVGEGDAVLAESAYSFSVVSFGQESVFLMNSALDNNTETFIVSKNWQDNADAYGTRPGSIWVSLFQNDTIYSSQELTADSNWIYMWENLPAMHDGVQYTYTVRESAVPGYTGRVDGNTITNRLDALDPADPTQLTVTYVPNNGQNNETETVNYGNQATERTPAWTGHVFKGWYMDNGTFQTPYDFTAAVTQDITLYAKWVSTHDTDGDGNPDEDADDHHFITFVYENAGATHDGAAIAENTGIRVDCRSSYSFTASANSGYILNTPSMDGSATLVSNGNNQFTLQNITSDITVTITATRQSTGGGGTTTTPRRPELEKGDHFAYIIGYEDLTVRPQNNITRAEVATIFFRLLTDASRDEYYMETNPYTDVSDTIWFNNAISTLSNAGIITGYPDGTFRPNAPITRAELAAIASRFDDLSGGICRLTDIAGHWAEELITAAYNKGWVDGYPDGTFRPNQNITRAEVMTLVNRLLERAVDQDGMLDDMVKWSDNQPDAWYYETVQEATNSHNYSRDEGETVETWTEITPPRDWSELEK